MKIGCEIIKDLIPLYHDEICSEDSKVAVENHLCECESCKKYYDKLKGSDAIEVAAFDEETEAQKSESIKKVRKKMKKKTLKIVLLVVAGYLVHQIIIAALLIGFFAYGYEHATVEINTDITKYKEYMSGEDALENYVNKWYMDETIFPVEITETMDVQDYKMVYYNPFDAQYLGYLVVEYDEADYEAELKRLAEYESTDYLGNYGVTGFQDEYELLAMYADDYHGFVYAITDGENTIVYVEIIFCNYFMDLSYEEYMPKEYFPVGFDATDDNEYMKKMTK